jgi:serine/threonine protein kinase/predicted negative regulator of RcsB-dependent stress response
MIAHEMTPTTVTCGSCRHEFAATALFCPHCGRPKVRDDGDVLLGRILGERFLVLERLGQGASGWIYRAEHVTLRRKVAIKVLHHELSRDDLAIERFRREATTVADIDNEHIVEIHDFGRTPDGRLYLAMELLEGETLDVVLARDGQLPVDKVADIMTQVGEALVEAHAIGYIHRDIRPRNVFLQVRRGRPNFVKLLDFGLAKLVESEGQAASTSLGMTFGDPRYMSPEQARGDAIDRRADLYQLGCVAYEMLTGQPPFVGNKVFDILSKHVSETPAPISKRRPDVPAWLEAAVGTMLAKKPEDRFATMSRMVEALRLGTTTGQILPVETARRHETEPPPSVSRAMQKLGKTALGPHGETPTVDDVRAAIAAAPPDPGATEANGRVGPRGTPRVGVPVLAADPVAEAPTEVDAHRPLERMRRPSQQPSNPGGVWQRPGADAVALAAQGPPAPATGKLPRTRRASDSAGISSVWYADGDKLDGGDELDERAAARLERARRLASSDSTSDVPAQKPIGLYIAIAIGALLLLGALIVVVFGGSGAQTRAGRDEPRPAAAPDAGTAAGNLVVDAAPAAVAPPDAAVAVAITPDAAPAKKTRVEKTEKTEKVDKPERDIIRPDPRTDPDVPPDDDPPEVTPDDEKKGQAEFFAKTGESQLSRGDTAGAASNFKKALELDPKNLKAVIGLAESAMSQGLYDAAIKHLKRAAKLAPRSARVHTLLGECYLNSGNNAAAEKAFKKALKIDPDNKRAAEGYNEAVARMPDPQDEP